MMLIEKLRNIENESSVLNDTTTRSSSTAAHDWTDLTGATKTFTLAAASMVAVYAKFNFNTNLQGNIRFLVDDIPVRSNPSTTVTGGTFGFLISLASGPHTIKIQTSWHTSGGAYSIDVTEFQIGIVSIQDLTGTQSDSGSIVCTTAAETTLVNISPTIPATRTVLAGALSNYHVLVFAYFEKIGDRKTKLKNSGDANESNYFNARIYVDSVAKDWTSRLSDVEFGIEANNPTYAEGSFGVYAFNVAASGTPNIQLRIYNGFGTNQNGRAVATIVICPWLFGDLSEPVTTLTPPQGSTLYLMAEPVFLNPSKTIYIGKVRGVTFGAGVDYFSTTTGIDRISVAYTFDTVPIDITTFRLSGVGGVLTSIGVDVR